jgi:RNA polymerase sigma-70 factor, ECF subfamily
MMTMTLERSEAVAVEPSSPGGRAAAASRADRDRELVAALRRGGDDGAERLLSTYGDRAYRLAVRITGNAYDAEEVIQDAFWSVVRKIETFRGDSAFGSWLYRIVANAAYQKIRSTRHERANVALDEVLPTFDERGRHTGAGQDWSRRVEDPSSQADLRMVITRALQELPPDARTVVVLRDVEGLSNGQIADALSLSIPAVKTRLHRARLFLRKRLGDSFEMPARTRLAPSFPQTSVA